MTERKLHGDYTIIFRKKTGEIINTARIEDAGSFNMDGIWMKSIADNLDRIEIKPTAFRVKEGDDVVTEWERK